MILLFAACARPTALEPDPSDAPTWSGEVAPIVLGSCAGCHAAGAIAADWPFTSYAEAAPYASMIAAYTESGRMPPFPADEADCDNPWGFTHDPRLTDDQVDTLAAWADAGAPEGDPGALAPIEPPAPPTLPRVDQSLRADTPYTIAPNDVAADTFACFVVDIGNPEPGWLEGVGVAPDNLPAVHHALVYLDPSGSTAGFVDETGWYDCFGGTGGDTILVGGYAPGATPLTTPAGSGIPVPAGSKLVVQMHYHAGDEPRVDHSAIELMWTAGPPAREVVVSLRGNAAGPEEGGMGLQPGPNDLGAPSFRIPAGVAGHTETLRYPIDTGGRDYAVFAVANHMHLVGTRMRAWVEKADGTEQCLLDTPRWDFDWQLIYGYDAARAPIVRSGDTLVLQCTYDNTLQNSGVQRALAELGLEAPVEVGLGEGTLDEMCIFFSGVVPVAQ